MGNTTDKEAYSQLCQTAKMGFFANKFQPLTISTNNFILND